MLLSFSWQSVAKSIIFINFKKNQTELANTVCENKNKPKSCCKAKCYLSKELKKEDNRQNNLPNGLKDKVEKTEILTTYLLCVFIPKVSNETPNFLYVENKPISFTKSIFQPPKDNLS